MSKCKIFLSAISFLIAYSLQLTAAYAEADIAVVEKPFLEGRYERAVREADRLIDERARQRYEVYYLKGLSELKLSRFNEARQSFNNIIAKYSKSNRVFDAYMGIGDSYLLEGNVQFALKSYNDMKEKFPGAKNITLVDSRIEDCRKKAGIESPSGAEEADVETPARAHVVTGEIPQSESKGYSSVQAGCFKSKRNADKLSTKLTTAGYESYVELPLAEGDRLYRVKVGRLKSKEEADALAAKLNRDGYKTKICEP